VVLGATQYFQEGIGDHGDYQREAFAAC
jgi:hypothetical protein